MNHFTLDLTLGNAAMHTAQDVAAALRKLADKLDYGCSTAGFVFDDNGNSVGTYQFKGYQFK